MTGSKRPLAAPPQRQEVKTPQVPERLPPNQSKMLRFSSPLSILVVKLSTWTSTLDHLICKNPISLHEQSSANLIYSWVFSTDLNAKSIGQHSAFDPAKSTTFKKVTGAQFKISYGDGSGAAGTVGTDVVTIGGVKVANQTVELANAVSQSFVQDINTDGLVGLAFSKLNTVNDGTKKTPAKTFFDNVMPSLDLPVFTADLDPDGTGVYEFGKIDTTKFQGQMKWVPVKAESGFWQFPSTKFAIGNKVFENPQASDAIADTGTSLLLVDQPVAEAYYSQVKGAQLNAQVGGFIYPCNAKLPDISVGIGANDMATIPGSQITFAAVDQANKTCFGGVQGNQGAGLQIFGDTMFKAQFVAFNGGNQSLGFGQKPIPGR